MSQFAEEVFFGLKSLGDFFLDEFAESLAEPVDEDANSGLTEPQPPGHLSLISVSRSAYEPRAQDFEGGALSGIIHFGGQAGKASVDQRTRPGPVEFLVGWEGFWITQRPGIQLDMVVSIAAFQARLFGPGFAKKVLCRAEEIAAKSAAFLARLFERTACEDRFEEGVGEIMGFVRSRPSPHVGEDWSVVDLAEFGQGKACRGRVALGAGDEAPAGFPGCATHGESRAMIASRDLRRSSGSSSRAARERSAGRWSVLA